MATTSTDWLYELRNHPIFQSESSEKLSLSLLASTSSNLNAKAAFGQDESRRGRKRKMCLRGSDLIVAVGNKLRITSLVDAKVDEGKGSYKTLETPPVHFEIQQMALNSTERMLAIGGSHHVAVVVLPKAGFSKTIGPMIRCRCFVIGPYFHSNPKARRLAKIDWHSLGDGGASLMVLTEDGILREYNVFENADEPKQTVAFFPTSLRRSRGYSTETPQRAVSFAFGRGDDDWSSLTAFCLTNKGEVFSICPFMPKRTTLPTSLIQHLSTSIEKNLKAVIADSTNPQPALEARYQQQLKYVKTLERQLKQDSKSRKQDNKNRKQHVLSDLQSSTSEPRPGEFVFTLPTVIKAPVVSQGPHRLLPEPPELDENVEPEATDLIYLHFPDPFSSSLNVLGIAWDSGRIDLCLDLDRVEGMWTVDSVVLQKGTPTLFLYETIDLGLTAEYLSAGNLKSALIEIRVDHNCPTFEQDSVYADTLYVYHDYGVHCIVMRKWLSALQKALAAEGDDLSVALQEAKGSEVGCMVNTVSSIYDQPNDVIGLVVVHDVYLSYSLLVVTSSYKLIASDLNLRVDKDTSLNFVSPSGTRAKRGLTYVSLLGRTPFEIPALFTRSPAFPITSINSSGLSDRSREGMMAFRVHAAGVEDKMSEFASEANKVQDRLSLQRKELERQLGTLAALQKKTKEVMTNGETILRPRLAEVLSEQKNLLKRADKILQQVMNCAQPTITEAEAEWIQELEEMEQEFDGRSEDSLQSRRDSVQWQMAALEGELKRIEAQDAVLGKSSLAKESGIGKSQLSAIDQRLSLQNTTLLELKDKLVEVEDHLNLNEQD